MNDSAAIIAGMFFVFVLAGLVKGVIGMGLPTVAMGFLVLVMPPVQAAALMVVPALVTNAWQLATGGGFKLLLRRFSTMMIAVWLGTWAGLVWLVGGAGAATTAALGAVLMVYGVLGLKSTRFAIPQRSERWLSPVIGLATGVIGGATGVFVIPAVPYFSSLGLEKDELVQILGISFMVCTLALATGLMASGKFEMTVALNSALALLPALGGMYLGQRIRSRLKPDVFRRWFFAGLIVLGAYMVFRSIAGT